jgi:hypothetical protein
MNFGHVIGDEFLTQEESRETKPTTFPYTASDCKNGLLYTVYNPDMACSEDFTPH